MSGPGFAGFAVEPAIIVPALKQAQSAEWRTPVTSCVLALPELAGCLGLSMTIRAFHRILASSMLLRGAYAVVLFLIVSSFRLGWGDPFHLGGFAADVIRGITPLQTVVWAMYAASYLIAALLALSGSRLALWVYAIAMSLDFWIWVLAALNPDYAMIWSGHGALVDLAFNIYDMAVLLCLIYLVHRRVLR
jgi:hypothetical protein